MVVYARVAPKRDTTRNWELHADFVPFRGELIIYTDKYSYEDEEGRRVKVPAIKIGDGHTKICDLPFLGGGTAPVRYDQLEGLPKIGGKTLTGDMSLEDLGIQKAGSYPETPFTADDIDAIIDAADSEDTEI